MVFRLYTAMIYCFLVLIRVYYIETSAGIGKKLERKDKSIKKNVSLKICLCLENS